MVLRATDVSKRVGLDHVACAELSCKNPMTAFAYMSGAVVIPSLSVAAQGTEARDISAWKRKGGCQQEAGPRMAILPAPGVVWNIANLLSRPGGLGPLDSRCDIMSSFSNP